MRIAVNTRFLLAGKLEGIGRFTHEILKRMVETHPEDEFIFFFDRPYDAQFVYGPNVKPVVLFPPARHPFLFITWFEVSVGYALRKYQPDVFLSTDGFLCLNTRVPSVAVFHDLAFIHYPQGVGKLMGWYYNTFFPRFAEKARHIAAVSEFTRQDVMKQYNVQPGKISVVYNAPGSGFLPLEEYEKSEVRMLYTDGKPYILYVGALHPRKNIGTLLKAFDEFKKRSSNEWKLVIVGRKAWKTEELEETFSRMQHQSEVIFTGRLEESELNRVTAAAETLVYIPVFEGFGLPIIEAMACGVPVITSNTSSMPEVAGNAAFLADPQNVDQITGYLLELLDQNVRNLRSALSLERASHFSWSASAERLYNILKPI